MAIEDLPIDFDFGSIATPAEEVAVLGPGVPRPDFFAPESDLARFITSRGELPPIDVAGPGPAITEDLLFNLDTMRVEHPSGAPATDDEVARAIEEAFTLVETRPALPEPSDLEAFEEAFRLAQARPEIPTAPPDPRRDVLGLTETQLTPDEMKILHQRLGIDEPTEKPFIETTAGRILTALGLGAAGTGLSALLAGRGRRPPRVPGPTEQEIVGREALTRTLQPAGGKLRQALPEFTSRTKSPPERDECGRRWPRSPRRKCES